MNIFDDKNIIKVKIYGNKIICIRPIYKKMYCNYNYERYNCDKQIVNDFVICNCYLNNKENIVYGKEIINKLEKQLYNINQINNDEYKVELKFEVVMYVKAREINNNIDNICEIYIINENKNSLKDNEKFQNIVCSDCDFAIQSMKNEEKFSINNGSLVEYEIIDKILFPVTKNINSTNRTVYCDKEFEEKIHVINRIHYAKQLESITYLIRVENGKLVLKNGYYNERKEKYEIVRCTIYDVEDWIDYLLEYDIPKESNRLTDDTEECDCLSLKSKLAQCGYSVKKGVSERDRKNALLMALNSGLKKSEIERFLMWHIDYTINNPYFRNANKKREDDLNFLRNRDLEYQRKVPLNTKEKIYIRTDMMSKKS